MANDAFNGSTATFAAAALGNGVISVQYSESGGNSDTTMSTSASHFYERGIPDFEVTIEFLGTTTVDKNDKGAIAISLAATTANTTPSMANAICTGVTVGGSIDGPVTGSATFKPSTAA